MPEQVRECIALNELAMRVGTLDEGAAVIGPGWESSQEANVFVVDSAGLKVAYGRKGELLTPGRLIKKSEIVPDYDEENPHRYGDCCTVRAPGFMDYFHILGIHGSLLEYLEQSATRFLNREKIIDRIQSSVAASVLESRVAVTFERSKFEDGILMNTTQWHSRYPWELSLQEIGRDGSDDEIVFFVEKLCPGLTCLKVIYRRESLLCNGESFVTGLEFQINSGNGFRDITLRPIEPIEHMPIVTVKEGRNSEPLCARYEDALEALRDMPEKGKIVIGVHDKQPFMIFGDRSLHHIPILNAAGMYLFGVPLAETDRLGLATFLGETRAKGADYSVTTQNGGDKSILFSGKSYGLSNAPLPCVWLGHDLKEGILRPVFGNSPRIDVEFVN